MTEITVTTEEEAAGTLAADHLRAALGALDEDGFVVLHGAVDPAHVTALRDKLFDDLPHWLARDDAPYNFNTGNVQQDAPPFPPYLFRDVLANDFVIAITKAALGTGVKNGFYSGNTAVPGGHARQPVHPDVAQIWPNLSVATPPFGLVVNVPLVDMDARNGSTEIWPGTHRDTTYSLRDGSIRIPETVLEARRAVRPPLQPTVSAGGIVIRDIRLWHAGMPNHTDTPRPMLAMIHWANWWCSTDRLRFPKGAEELLAHPDLHTIADFTDEPIEYLRNNQAYDFRK
jgi:hypothetical protein